MNRQYRSFWIAGLAATALPLHAATLVGDNFNSYGDAPLSNPPNTASSWNRHSGTGNNLLVQGGAVQLLQADTVGNKDDAHRLFDGGLKFKADGDADSANNYLYASFGVMFTALPTDSGGSYFAHFKSSTANEFYGRIWAGQEAGGKFSLRISSESGSNGETAAKWGQALDLNVSYTVYTRINVDTGESTLWVNPLGESSPGAVSTDAWGFQGEIEAFALRQGTTTPSSGIAGGPGSLIFDDLLVGTTFASVMPIPEPSGLFLLGAAVLGGTMWGRRSRSR
jgi:hypothetical protein